MVLIVYWFIVAVLYVMLIVLLLFLISKATECEGEDELA
jgi:hypothetical protein